MSLNYNYLIIICFIFSCKSSTIDQYHKARDEFNDTYEKMESYYLGENQKVITWTDQVTELLAVESKTDSISIFYAKELGGILTNRRMHYVEARRLSRRKRPEADPRFALDSYKEDSERVKSLFKLLKNTDSKANSLSREISKFLGE